MRLSLDQRAYFTELLRLGIGVRWCGIDADGLPVIQTKDARGVKEPFAVCRCMSIRPATVEPHEPVRQFTDDDLDTIDIADHELICRFRRTPFE